MTNFVGDTFTGGDCCHGSTRVEHSDAVQQARDAHVQAVSAQLDTAYADSVNTVKKWVASIKQWNQHLPPRPPTAAPTVADGSGTVPIGNWVDGAAVRYAVAFANQSGPSQVGPWSGFKTITTKAYAILSDLPTDSLAMTVNRWIYRQFRRADGTVEPCRIVGITNATVTNYEDKKE